MGILNLARDASGYIHDARRVGAAHCSARAATWEVADFPEV